MKISLEEAKKLPITSLYLAVVKVPMSSDELEDYTFTHPFSFQKVTYKEAISEVFEAHKTDAGTLGGISKGEFINEKLQLASESLSRDVLTVVTANDKGIIDLGKRGIDFATYSIEYMVPFKDYYDEGNYFFKVVNGRPIIKFVGNNFNPAKKAYKEYLLRKKLLDLF